MSHFEATARFLCPKCNVRVFTPVPLPELDFEDKTTVKCPNCATAFQAECLISTSDCQIKLVDFPNTNVDCAPPEDTSDKEDWVDWDTPGDPKAIFMDSYYHTGDLLAEYGGKSGTHLVNRMIFAQQVSALEAYLSDTLVNFVMNNEEAMKNLLKSDRDLASKKFSLTEIMSDEALVKNEVITHLKQIMYHNIPRVRHLYIIATNVDIYQLLGSAKGDLLTAIERRHDCVHRNGRDKAGNLLDVFTKNYVQNVADLMRRFVRKIDKQLVPSRQPALPNRRDDDLPF